MSRVLVGPVRSPPATGGHPRHAPGSVRYPRTRDGQEPTESLTCLYRHVRKPSWGLGLTLPLSGITPNPIRSQPLPCARTRPHTFPNAVPIGPTSPCPGESPSETRAASPDSRVDRGSPTSRRVPQAANQSSPVEASSVRARRSGVCGHPAITTSRSASHRSVLFCR